LFRRHHPEKEMKAAVITGAKAHFTRARSSTTAINLVQAERELRVIGQTHTLFARSIKGLRKTIYNSLNELVPSHPCLVKIKFKIGQNKRGKPIV
jgi:hypothetical protein